MHVKKLLFVLLFYMPLVNASHCLVDVQPLAFGDYDIFYPAPLDTQAFINLQCSSNDPYRVSADAGMDGDGSYSFRRMTGAGSTRLMYNLYLDVSRRQVWGDGNGSSAFYSGSPVNGRAQLVYYGRLPPGQQVEAGVYRDSVIVTVEW